MRYEIELLNGNHAETVVWIENGRWSQCGGGVCFGSRLRVSHSEEGGLTRVNTRLVFWDNSRDFMTLEIPLRGLSPGDSGPGSYAGTLQRLSNVIGWRVVNAS